MSRESVLCLVCSEEREVGGEGRWLQESDLLVHLLRCTSQRITGVPRKLCFSHLGSKLRLQRYLGPSWPTCPAFGSHRAQLHTDHTGVQHTPRTCSGSLIHFVLVHFNDLLHKNAGGLVVSNSIS